MPKESFQMKQELNYQTIGLCYELGEDKEEGMSKDTRQIDKTPEITKVMGMEETILTENSNKMVTISHSKEIVSMKNLKIKNGINILGKKIDNNKECE